MIVKINKNQFFNMQNFDLKENVVTTILGANESGKSFLAKILKKELKLNKIYDETIIPTMNENLKKILKKFNYLYLFDCHFDTMSCGEKQILIALSSLITNDEIIIFDDLFGSIEFNIVEKIFKQLRQSKKTVINITSNPEEVILSNYVCLINNGDIILNDKIIKSLRKEQMFKSAGVSLPFISSLSIKLGYYDLTNKMYIDKKKLVNDLWK